MVYESIDALIGRTPILHLSRLEREMGLSCRLLAKLELFNPAGSVKDRVALSMLDDAEATGRLLPGGAVIEPTSGNTGIGLAALAAARGYRAIIVMPDTMSVERQKLIRAYGAEVVLTEGRLGMAGAIREAERIAEGTKGSVIVGQFENPANPRAHYETTGPEIFRDTDGRVDVFVAGIGTGGTITGVAHYLKEKIPTVRTVGVEPSRSPLLTEGRAGAHGIQGIGANFLPATLDRSVIDEVVTVSDEVAARAARLMATTEGVLVGISSGAALAAACRLGTRPDMKGKTVLALLPDTGERYLSSNLF